MKRLVCSVLSGIALSSVLLTAGDSWGEEKKLYKVETKDIALKQGAKGEASFAIVLVEGAKIHPKAPFKCDVSASQGLALEKNKLGHADTKASSDHRHVQVPVSLTPKEKGPQSVQMDCSFYVCTKDICVRKEEAVKIKTSVQ